MFFPYIPAKIILPKNNRNNIIVQALKETPEYRRNYILPNIRP
jgi:hypothetical protein